MTYKFTQDNRHQQKEMQKFVDKKWKDANDVFSSNQKIAEGLGNLESVRPLSENEKTKLLSSQKIMNQVLQYQDKDNVKMRKVFVDTVKKEIGPKETKKMMERYYAKRNRQ